MDRKGQDLESLPVVLLLELKVLHAVGGPQLRALPAAEL